jgi:hypothetical protein
MFGLVDRFLEKNGLLWSNYVVISSDDVKTLTGRKKGFTFRVKGVAAHVIFRYCMMCRKESAVRYQKGIVKGCQCSEF